jgi:hypothetical protein
MNYKLNTFIFFALFFLYSCQITVLGPPSIVNKVKELEDGSKQILIIISLK